MNEFQRAMIHQLREINKTLKVIASNRERPQVKFNPESVVEAVSSAIHGTSPAEK